jgi:hypothetical protein
MAIEIPSFKENRQTYLAAGGVAAAYVGYRWWTARGTSGEEPADTAVDGGSVTDTPGGDYGPGNVQYGGADISDPAQISTNAEWTAFAVAAMVQQGWDGQVAQAAIGKYLTDQVLTATEEGIVRAAVAVAGWPPQGKHTITSMPAPTPTPTPPPTAPKPSAPKSAPSGFHNLFVSSTSAESKWSMVPGATNYEVEYGAMFKNPGAIRKTSGATTATFYGLKPATRYTYRVRATSSAGAGPWSGTQWFRTK